ncbi:nicotinamide mononucleotide permease [Fusarium mexicanum]|uniref:non-specific serine/threonine protein kinase n=1 Tax=Fusarium mexicanum TaxID=751941 RepID=A0A8H5N9K7_9HYPO|nr:nicotinamide mononucleotide permease [Fusarium mexicanum]
MSDKIDEAGGPRISQDENPKSEQQPFDPILEKKVIRKVDRNLVPILFLLFLCAFIDRINIGNARIQGLEADLNMSGEDYNIALFTFFILYILLEVPCNILLKNMRPSLFLSAIMTGWGIVTICQGLTQSFAGLIACRVIIGGLEAGFFPACVYLLSMYYCRHELQWRFNLFFSASIVAGAFSGLLAYAIAHMDGIAGYGGWRWIFIIEGAATVVIAIWSYWMIPDWPETAKFLNDDERALLVDRLAADKRDTHMNTWDKRTAKRIFSDVKIYLGILMYMGIVTTSYSGSFFTPTILRQLGWTSIRAQIMSISIFLFSTVCALVSAIASDKTKHRSGFILGGCLFTTVGYVILLNMMSVSVAIRYMALFFIVGGGYIAQPIVLVWVSNNMAGHYKLGVASAMQIGFGNIGGIIASNIFVTTQAPTYPLGFGLGLGLVWLCGLSSLVFLFYIRRENKLRDEVSASVVGLLGAGAKITSCLWTFATNARDAPQLARHLVFEVADITAALGSLQAYVCGQAQAPGERGALILLEHVLTTLTGCVTTFSDLQSLMDQLNLSPDMGTIDKMKWARQESNIAGIVQRLQNHKSSLTLMLTVLQCSTRHLCTLVQELLRSNQDLASRIRGLEREGSIIAESRRDDFSTLRQTRGSKSVSFIDTQASAIKFTFDQDLQASRVYNRAIGRQSMASLTSTALYTTALSLFSNLSLSQVSNISFYALPVYSNDLSNSDCYVFGEEGALGRSNSSQAPKSSPSQQKTQNRAENIPPLTNQAPAPSRLLGRFARRRKTPVVSAPENPYHLTHVGFDDSTGQFLGLPKEWQRLLDESAIVVEELPT